MRLDRVSIFGLCALLALSTGCGGDDGSTTSGAAGASAAGTSGAGGHGGTSSMSSGGGGAGGSVSMGGSGPGGAGQDGSGGASALDSGSPPIDGSINDAKASSDAALGPLTLVTSAGRATGIALSATDVYWASEDKDSISSCPKTGCAAGPPTVVVATPAPRGIALRGTTLYWITKGTSDASSAPSIKKCTLGSCAASQIVDLDAGYGFGPKGWVALAVDDRLFYVAGGPFVGTCPIAGCGDASVAHLGGIFTGPIFGVAVNSTAAYTGRTFGGLYTCPLSGCSSSEDESKVLDTPPTLAVALDNSNLYWSEFPLLSPMTEQDGAIRTCPLSGCTLAAAKVLAVGSIVPYAIAVDETNLYYTDNRNGSVQRIPKSDSSHTCALNHLASCGSCGGLVKCDGTCSIPCMDAGTD